METETPTPKQSLAAQRLAKVLVRCRDGLAMSRQQAEAALQRVAEVEAALDKLAVMSVTAAAGDRP